MLGIALGAFSQGFTQGMNMGVQLHDIRKQRKLESAVEGIAEKGKAEFDAGVASGEFNQDDFMSFYANHMVPETASKFLEAGEPDKAAAWMDWADSQTTKSASKSFAQGLHLLQTGETQKGIDAMLKAANTKGYGLDGKVTAAEYYDEDAGAVTGYRLTFTQKDGQVHTKDVAAEDLATFFAHTVNPQAAFEAGEATKAAETKADLEVKTHVRKKTAEAELGLGTGALTSAQYQNAIQEERKAIEERTLLSGEDLTDDEKEQLAKDTVDKRFGRPTATNAGPQVAVDPETGEQVPLGGAETPATDAAAPAAAAPEEEATPSVDTTETPVGAMPADAQETTGAVAAGVSAPTPAAQTSEVASPDQQTIAAQAAQLIKQGANAQMIGRKLMEAGIPPESWPQDVKLAVQNQQLGVSR